MVDCWIRFLISRCWCSTEPSTRLLALAGENQNIMLLLSYRNQRITIVSKPFSPLKIRSWPKIRIHWKWLKLFVRWVISPLVIHLPVIALTSPPGIMILTRIYELGKQTKACSGNSRQQTKRKQQKTAAVVIIKNVLHEKSFWKWPQIEFSKVASILAGIPAISCLVERSFSRLWRLKTYLRSTMGQNSLAIICIERSYGNKSIANSMDSILTFFQTTPYNNN